MKMKLIKLNAILLFAFFFASSCATLPSTPQYTITGQDCTFEASYDKVWSALISVISNIEWETEFINDSSGIIKFRTSYVHSDIFGRSTHRIYHWPKVIDVKYSNIEPYLKKYAYSDKKLYGNIKFCKQNLKIKAKKIDPNKVQIDIDFKMESFTDLTGSNPVRSNGLFEYEILNLIKENLI